MHLESVPIEIVEEQHTIVIDNIDHIVLEKCSLFGYEWEVITAVYIEKKFAGKRNLYYKPKSTVQVKCYH